jgi:hypothetical protein
MAPAARGPGSLEESGGLDSAGPLFTQAALIAWYCGDGSAARTFVDRGLEAALRLGDLDLEIRARRCSGAIWTRHVTS